MGNIRDAAKTRDLMARYAMSSKYGKFGIANEWSLGFVYGRACMHWIVWLKQREHLRFTRKAVQLCLFGVSE